MDGVIRAASPGWGEVVDLWADLLDHLPVEAEDSTGLDGRVGRSGLEQPNAFEHEATYPITNADGGQARHQPTQGVANEVDLAARNTGAEPPGHVVSHQLEGVGRIPGHHASVLCRWSACKCG